MKKLLSLVPWLLLCYAAAGLGAIATADAPGFYAALDKPSWAPPAAIFGPVWTVLYGMMAVSAWLIWQRRARTALILFIVQLGVNALWSWVFFAWHQGALALINIAVLWVLILLTILSFNRIHRVAALLLVPYLAWVSFATALTFSVWQRNPALL